MAGTTPIGAEAKRTRRWRSLGLPRLGAAVALIALATAVTVALGLPHLSEADIVMVYLAVIMFCAVRLGRAAAVLASAASVLAFDFFFIEPFHTLSVSDPRNVFTFVMLFAVGLFISALSVRLESAELRRRNEETKTELLSAVSHDLRTPLATILGAATTLRENETAIPAAERRALLDSIVDESARLERLVADLLDMTKLHGAVVLRRDWVPLDEVIGSALDRTEAQLGSRTVELVLPPAALLHVDATLFEQLLVNLLDNVARHTPPDTHVIVGARLDSRTGLALWVDDDGPGLPAGTDVFARFVRGPQAARGGVGLGLSICRAIAEAHGGSLDAAGGARGRGTRMTVTLPPATEAAPSWTAPAAREPTAEQRA